MNEQIHIRKRMICLKPGVVGKQADDACVALRGIKGVLKVYPLSNRRIHLTYSLENLSFELIEGLLAELGFKLDNSILAILRRTVYQYLEDNVREKLHVDEDEHEHEHSLMCHLDGSLEHEEPEKYWNDYR